MQEFLISSTPKSKYFDVEIRGDFAMFATPTSKQSCEMISYPMPTYSALCGIMRHVYYRPGIIWVIDKCRILNEIQYASIPIKTPHCRQRYFAQKYNPQRFVYTYLQDVRYQIRAYYILDTSFIMDSHGFCSFTHDEDIEHKIQYAPEKMVHLGKSNGGIAEIGACVFGQGEGYYDNTGCMDPIYMFHSFRFKSSCWYRKIVSIGFCNQVANDGIIDFSQLDVNYIKVDKRC